MARPDLNLQDPFQGRRWLRLLQPDAGCGFLLKPNLDVPERSLGFSLRSNSFGLRGPEDPSADQVIFGTSYAMGIAVDNGENWWEIGLENTGWMNLGLAVGFREWGELLRRFHRGSPGRAWLLYHPNFWVHCRMYERWRQSGKDIFEALRWRRSYSACAYLAFRRRWRRRRLLESGRVLLVDGPSSVMEIDTTYVDVGLETVEARSLFERNVEILASILAPFREVRLVRLRTKQELVPTSRRNLALQATCRGYDQLYEATCTRLRLLGNVQVERPPDMALECFHPMDSHWNAAGNRCFGLWFKQRR